MNGTMTMDIQRPSNARGKKIRRIIYIAIAIINMVDAGGSWNIQAY